MRAKYISNESLYLFATRLEKLFSVAFPKKDIQTSKTLREKFMSLLPGDNRRIVRNQVMNRKMENRKMKWDDMKKIASLCDVERNGVAKTSDTDDIIINVGLSSKPRYSSKWKPDRYDNQTRDRHIFTRPPSSYLMDKSVTCTYCDRIGHVEAKCRAKLGLCFCCGSSDHFSYNCPRNVRRQWQNQRYNIRPQAANNQAMTESNRYQRQYSSHQDLRVPGCAGYHPQRRPSGN